MPILEKADGKRRSILEWKKTDVFFIDLLKTKVDQNCYIDLLKTSLLPECRRLYPGNGSEFLQDSVPLHRVKVTQKFLQQNNPDFISADEWASYSPDLIPLDYCISDILQDLVYEGRRFRLQIYRTSKRQSKQMEGGHHWDSSKIHCTMEQEVKVIWQKAPRGGPIPRLGVTPGGWKLYHWIPGVGFPISVP